MTKLIDSLQFVAACSALFATSFSFFGASDVLLFLSDYFAGFASGAALLIWLDD